jgi:hypothetical protein
MGDSVIRYFCSPSGGLLQTNSPAVIENMLACKWREVSQDKYLELLRQEQERHARQDAGEVVEDA